ncbi:MAG: MTH938/NDUFAF3 family protein [Candidatus Micrarchaeia archaeon]|jgi:hypothetical protein
MVCFESTGFGWVTADGKKYRDVLVVAGKLRERDLGRLHKLFGTGHKIGEWEVEALCGGKPEVILVGNGQDGVLEVGADLREAAARAGAELEVMLTPAAIIRFNELTREGKRVNALIHTTC